MSFLFFLFTICFPLFLFSNEKIREFDCFVYGVGGGFLHNRANDLSIDFRFKRFYSIDEVRELYIGIFLDFCDFTMRDKKLLPYLNHVPLSIREITINLSFNSPNEKFSPSTEHIIHSFIGRGCTLLFVPESQDNDIEEEPFRESIWDSIEIMRTSGKLKPYPWLDDWILREKELQKEREAAGSW